MHLYLVTDYLAATPLYERSGRGWLRSDRISEVNMNKNREYDRLNARIEELERQVADLQRSLDEIAPGYKELARYVADMRARLHEVEENVYRPWRSAA